MRASNWIVNAWRLSSCPSNRVWIGLHSTDSSWLPLPCFASRKMRRWVLMIEGSNDSFSHSRFGNRYKLWAFSSWKQAPLDTICFSHREASQCRGEEKDIRLSCEETEKCVQLKDSFSISSMCEWRFLSEDAHANASLFSLHSDSFHLHVFRGSRYRFWTVSLTALRDGTYLPM